MKTLGVYEYVESVDSVSPKLLHIELLDTEEYLSWLASEKRE
jgi:bacterioferritin (cytochrome b1)